MTLDILMGEGPKRDAVLHERRCVALYRRQGGNLGEGVQLAGELIDSGKALQVLGNAAHCEQSAGGGGMNILDQLADYARQRVEAAKQQRAAAGLRQQGPLYGKGRRSPLRKLKTVRAFLYLRVQKGVPLQRADRPRVSLSANRQGIRSSRGRRHLRADRTQMVSRGQPVFAGDCRGRCPFPVCARILPWTNICSMRPRCWGPRRRCLSAPF